jgi:anthranilate synthase component 1
LPRFYGGAVGFFSYDMVRFFEDLPDTTPDDLDTPDSCFIITKTILAFDHLEHNIKIISNVFVDDKCKNDTEGIYKNVLLEIEKMEEKLKEPVSSADHKASNKKSGPLKSNFRKEDFIACVKKAKEYIQAGDIIQVVLSQRFKRETSADSFDIYRSLRSINPSPYMYYLQYNGTNIIGASPELLVREENKVVDLRPIAGTRPRGKNKEEDKDISKELLSDPKERAEHIMLVDLN